MAARSALWHLVPLGLTALAWPWAALSNTLSSREAVLSPLPAAPATLPPADDCGLFDTDEATRRLNRQRRLARLESAERDESDLWVVHRADWTTPRRAIVPHLRLLETHLLDTATPEAVVQIEGLADNAVCDNGYYRVRVDDHLGPDASVLAIVDGIVLLESGGQLLYLSTPDAVPPEWRMAWQAPWIVVEPRIPTTGIPARGVTRR